MVYFLQRIRRHRSNGNTSLPYENALMVTQIEADLAQPIASRFAEIVVREGGGSRLIEHTCTLQKDIMVPGVWTTKKKHEYQTTTARYLTEGRLSVAKDCICITTDGNVVEPKIVEDRPDATLKELDTQLRRYSVVDTETMKAGVPEHKYGLTGKLGGRCDDLAMALQILVYNTDLRTFNQPWIASQLQQGRSLCATSASM